MMQGPMVLTDEDVICKSSSDQAGMAKEREAGLARSPVERSPADRKLALVKEASGQIYLDVSSTDHPGYNNTANCSIGSTGGSCSTPTYAYDSSDPNFTAHVSCYGNVHEHRLPICGHYGEPPCNENLSTTIDIYFP